MAIYKKKVSVGAFLKKGEDFKDGDTAEIASEGKQIEGQFGMQDIFMIKLADEREGNIGFNQTSMNNIIDGYGEDSINWIGKKIKIQAIMSNVKGKMTKVYYFLHPDAELDEDSGEFVLPKSEKIDLPELTQKSGEVEEDSIPF